jgi:hypothetical protein
MLEAIVNQNKPGSRGGWPVWYLHVRKQEGHGLPNRDGKRVPIILVIDGREFRGNIGSRADYPYIYISPGLVEVGCETERKLAAVLQEYDIEHGGRVRLSVDGHRITVHI